jgi:type 1 glutamine amidotransferase
MKNPLPLSLLTLLISFGLFGAISPGADPKDPAPKAPAVDPYDQSKVPLEVEPPADFKGKKIVLVAGKQSHGPGDHEFFAGTAILMNLLKQTPGVWPVMARDGWPKNEKIFDGADSLIFYMDGRDGHPVAQGDHMQKLQKYIDQGVGWVNLHYAVDYTPEAGDRVLSWMGGYYDKRISINPHWDADFRELPQHPITRGVKPFTLRDEWYYNMRFVEGMKNVTPILIAIPPDNTRGTEDAKAHPGRPEIMAWAYERKDGGRGFGFTGAHFHRNWADENFRRIVVNAILWTAKVDIPEGGAKVEFDPAELNKNLDRKGKGEFKPILPPTRKEGK